MKSIFLALFSLSLFASSLAHADDLYTWNKVLSCDGGAVVVDNMFVLGRGGKGIAAQVVIRNPQIVAYFQQNGAAGRFVDGQWIGASYFMPFQAGPGNPLENFDANGIVVVYQWGSLTVNTGGANWTFRSCQAQ